MMLSLPPIFSEVKTYRVSQAEISKRIKEELKQKIDRIEDFSFFSSQFFDEFTQLIMDAQDEKVKVIFYMEPLYPKLYSRIKSEYPNVILSEILCVEFNLIFFLM